jgi:hypothetical protein
MKNVLCTVSLLYSTISTVLYNAQYIVCMTCFCVQRYCCKNDRVREVTALHSYFLYKMYIYINYQLLIINLTLVASE